MWPIATMFPSSLYPNKLPALARHDHQAFVIRGGTALKGDIVISGAKNSVLPLMASSLLTRESLKITNVPGLSDVYAMWNILAKLGSVLTKTDDRSNGFTLTLSSANLTSNLPNFASVRSIRASILLLGPLLARTGCAILPHPGGCAIGARPVDLHVYGLQQLGASIEETDSHIVASVPNGLRGARVDLPLPSVGATENIVMAATLAKGTTTLNGAATDPEIVDLANCLVSMGASIYGAGTETITIHGVDSLFGSAYTVMADRMEAGSFACAAAITGGDVTLRGIDSEILEEPIRVLRGMGVSVDQCSTAIRVKGNVERSESVTTYPYPGFPTDLQPIFTSLLTVAPGTSIVKENIFEDRFKYVPELCRLGADVVIYRRNEAMVNGVHCLNGSEVTAGDLRGGMSMIIAGLRAQETTTVAEAHYLDRGYVRLEQKLKLLGGDIIRVNKFTDSH